jgi:hypothetical protein
VSRREAAARSAAERSSIGPVVGGSRKSVGASTSAACSTTGTGAVAGTPGREADESGVERPGAGALRTATDSCSELAVPGRGGGRASKRRRLKIRSTTHAIDQFRQCLDGAMSWLPSELPHRAAAIQQWHLKPHIHPARLSGRKPEAVSGICRETQGFPPYPERRGAHDLSKLLRASWRRRASAPARGWMRPGTWPSPRLDQLTGPTRSTDSTHCISLG